MTKTKQLQKPVSNKQLLKSKKKEMEKVVEYSDVELLLFEQYTKLGMRFVSLMSNVHVNRQELIEIDREMDMIKNSMSNKCIMWVS